MRTIFGRHRVRANFYHFVSCLYVLVMIFWGIGILPDMASTIIGFVLFAIDYIAQMYDPHPDNPGPWFRSHFGRFFNDDDDGDINEDDGISSLLFLKGLFVIALVFSIAYTVTIYADDRTVGETTHTIE